MEKQKSYPRIIFTADHIKEALLKWLQLSDTPKITFSLLIIHFENERWEYDSDEEFFSWYRRGFNRAALRKQLEIKSGNAKLEITAYGPSSYMAGTDITVSGKSASGIESIFEVFEKYVSVATLPPEPPKISASPTIFIGHGQSPQWRDLKDHLHEKQGYDVEAYEIAARAGHAIRDVLEEMLTKSSFAILIMTGEDETIGGKLLARQNVIHETGLFQGRLGFSRAIILLEDGCEEFTNIHGINQIRYSKGNIRETYGEILATLRREFEQKKKRLGS